MVELSFRDDKGQSGQITDTLDVEYSGEWEEEVSEGVDRIASEASPAEQSREDEQVFTQIVLELPEKAPIAEVERTDEFVIPDPIKR